MSESLNAVRADGCEARPKAGQATVLAEAGRRRGSVDPRWPNHPDAKSQARTCSEPMCSAAISSHSNVDIGDAEPLQTWRRQYLPPLSTVMVESLGVAGRACGEGCPKESGRPSIVLKDGKVLDNWLQMIPHIWSRQSFLIDKVRGAISATRERRPNAMLGVRGDCSSEEIPVTGMEAKSPHFDEVTDAMTGSPSHRNV